MILVTSAPDLQLLLLEKKETRRSFGPGTTSQ